MIYKGLLMSDYIVEMHNISKRFPGVQALDQVSFTLKAGEVLGLLGKTVRENLPS